MTDGCNTIDHFPIEPLDAPIRRNGDIVFRPLMLEDFGKVLSAYHQQWGAYEGETPTYSLAAVTEIFEKATFGFIAEVDGVYAGHIIGHAKRGEHLALPDNWISCAAWRRRLGEESAAALGIIEWIEACNEKLERDAAERGRRFEAFLDFLWVAPQARGMALSKRLLAKAFEHFRQARHGRLALFTDSWCDVGFYLREPWVQEGVVDWPLFILRGQPAKSFMFSMTIPSRPKSELALSSPRSVQAKE